MEYTEALLNEFYNPANVGVIKGASAVGKIVDDESGEIVKIYITVEDNKVIDAKFQTYGCVPSIACSSVATRMIIGLTLDEISANITAGVITKEIGKLPEGKNRSAEMAELAVKAAVKNYYKKSKGEKVDED